MVVAQETRRRQVTVCRVQKIFDFDTTSENRIKGPNVRSHLTLAGEQGATYSQGKPDMNMNPILSNPEHSCNREKNYGNLFSGSLFAHCAAACSNFCSPAKSLRAKIAQTLSS